MIKVCCYSHAEDIAKGKSIDDRCNIMMRIFVCSECGNKRCPKATDCNLECTGSNKSNQDGSRYSSRYTGEKV